MAEWKRKRNFAIIENVQMEHKHNITLIIALVVCLTAIPQMAVGANVLRTAKEAIKKNQNLANTAKTLVEEAKKEETKHRDRVECYRLAAECHRRIHLQENTKLYLKQSYDTTLFFSSLLEMYRMIELSDSVAAQPDEKGKTHKVNYRKSHDYLQPHRANILNGGKWLLQRRRLREAYSYFDAYIHVADMPAFADDKLLKTDSQMAQAAYMAAYIANSEKMPDAVIKHAALAKQATGQKVEFIQEYLSKAYLEKTDTASMESALREGLAQWPEHEYFFSRLLDHYADTEQFEKGLSVADSMLTADDRKPLYWYARSLFLLKLHEDSQAILACDQCIALDSTYADAYYNKGIATLNMAVVFARTACTDLSNPQCQRDQEVLRGLYMSAKEPMEMVRQLRPDDTQRWAAPLYRIYLNLNMGKEFDEMDMILNQPKS